MAATSEYTVTTAVNDDMQMVLCRNGSDYAVTIANITAQLLQDVIQADYGVENAGKVLTVMKDGRVGFGGR